MKVADNLAEIGKMLGEGESINKVAKHFGIATSTFHYQLAQCGMKIKTVRLLEPIEPMTIPSAAVAE